MVKITTLGGPLEVGTRVHWDAASKSLYYVDVPTSEVYRYLPASGKITKAKVGSEPLGFAFPVQGSDNKFIAGLARRFVTFTWDGTSDKVSNLTDLPNGAVDTDPALAKNRINGGKVDPKGRLWAGTMGESLPDGSTAPGKGSLYCVDKGNVTTKDTNIGISNGLAWNVAKKKMYYIDTMFLGIYQYDYDPDTANLTNKKVLFKFADNNIDGSPDGLTIDTDGNLWAAVIWGSHIIKVDGNNGKLLQKIEMPVAQVTAVSFGGDKLDVLYVNTAKMEKDGKTPPSPAGCNFTVENLGVKGLDGDKYIEK